MGAGTLRAVTDAAAVKSMRSSNLSGRAKRGIGELKLWENDLNQLIAMAVGKPGPRHFHSNSAFDKARHEAGQGEYATAAWAPAKANTCLFRSRILFPEIRSWTADTYKGVKSPMEKAIYGLKTGDKL